MLKNINIFNINLKLEVTKKKNHSKLVILNYHQVGKKMVTEYNNHGNFTHINFFEKQIIWLKNEYKIITLENALKIANTNKIDRNYACITFDDGDKSILDAMIVLEKHNVPATFFINGGYIDNKSADWFHVYQYIKNSPKFCKYIDEDIRQNISHLRSTCDINLYNKYSNKIENLYEFIKDDFDMFIKFQDLININSNLFHIGSHGWEHQRFSMKSKDWQKANITKDIDTISSLKSYRPIFAIPFGRPHDWNMDTIDTIRELNLDFVYANGGVNINRSVGYQRIPADGRALKDLI